MFEIYHAWRISVTWQPLWSMYDSIISAMENVRQDRNHLIWFFFSADNENIHLLCAHKSRKAEMTLFPSFKLEHSLLLTLVLCLDICNMKSGGGKRRHWQDKNARPHKNGLVNMQKWCMSTDPIVAFISTRLESLYSCSTNNDAMSRWKGKANIRERVKF